MDRLTNYLLGLALISIFALAGEPSDQLRIILAAVISLLFCLFAFLFKWLTLDGAIAASMVGTISLGLGGWPAGILLLVFFTSSSLISKKSRLIVESLSHDYLMAARRNGLQVWSNGFWFTLFVLLAFLTSREPYMVAGIGALATATSDTWATELGSKRFQVETYIMEGFKKVTPGTDGGISLPGTMAAVAGSLLISILAIYLFNLPGMMLLAIFSGGFLGCFVDSYLGAKFQGSAMSFDFSPAPFDLNIEISNNFVNWASTGAGSIIALTLNIIMT